MIVGMSQNQTTTNASAATTAQIQVVIETRGQRANPDFQRAVNAVIEANPTTRQEVAEIIRKSGFWPHAGGRHVALIYAGERLAMFVHPTAPDFN